MIHLLPDIVNTKLREQKKRQKRLSDMCQSYIHMYVTSEEHDHIFTYMTIVKQHKVFPSNVTK